MEKFPDLDLTSTLEPTGRPEREDLPKRSLSGVEIGVITVAAAIAIVTFCMLLSVVRASS